MKLQLHYAGKSPDWETVPPTKQNGWQRIAAATHGIITIGNFFSLLSLLSVPIGLVYILASKHYIGGSSIILAGRICDMLDGYLADKTGTKSPLGEAIDAGSDKIMTVGCLLVLAVSRIVPVWIVVLVIAPQLIIALLATAAIVRHRKLRPVSMGKISMGFGWVGLLAYVATTAVTGAIHNDIRKLAAVLLAVSIVLGAVAVGDHWRAIRKLFRPAGS